MFKTPATITHEREKVPLYFLINQLTITPSRVSLLEMTGEYSHEDVKGALLCGKFGKLVEKGIFSIVAIRKNSHHNFSSKS